MLGSINYLGSSKQVSTAHAVINQSPHGMAFHVSILKEERYMFKRKEQKQTDGLWYVNTQLNPSPYRKSFDLHNPTGQELFT